MSQTKHRVLLTGANGFIGNHILAQLLSAGFSVRAIVRSQSKADSLLQTHSSAGHNLDFSIVPDITAHDAFTEAYQSEDPVDTVIHTTSPFLYREVNNNHDLLNPAIKGTMEILKGAKNVPSIKRIIILSSIAAIMDYSETSPPGGRLWTDRDWNPVTWEETSQAEDYSTVYRASKTFSEKAAWEFMKEQKPHFDLVSLNPPMVYGPILHPISEVSQLNESNLRIWDLFINSSKGAELPPNGVYSYVDIRDIALAHVRAVLKPEVGNKRVIVGAGSVTSQEIADILRSEIPALAGRTPVGNLGENTLPINPYSVDIGPARDILGLEFLSKKATFVDLARQLLEIEQGNTGH